MLRLARVVLVLGVAALCAGAEGQRPPKLEQPRFRLELHVPEQTGIYFTAWAAPDGTSIDVIADRDGSDGQSVTYRRQFVWIDRCTWETTEKLVPVAANKYAYAYREAPVSCPAGARAVTESVTPRDGHVLVYPIKEPRPLTPLYAWIDRS